MSFRLNERDRGETDLPLDADDLSLNEEEEEEDDEEEREEEEEADEGLSVSQASEKSQGVDPTSRDLGPRDLVDLRGDNFCRVIMTQRGARRICGLPSVICKRTRHAVLRMIADRRGLPSWYVAYTTRLGEIDGLLDHPYTDEQYETLVLAEDDRRRALLHGFDPGLEEDSLPDLNVVVETVDSVEEEEEGYQASSPVSHGGRASTLRPRPLPTIPPPLPGSRVLTNPRSLVPPVRTLPTRMRPTSNLYYGVENLTTGDREVTQDMEIVKVYVAALWQLRKTFTNGTEAEDWKTKCGLCFKAHPMSPCIGLVSTPLPPLPKPALKKSGPAPTALAARPSRQVAQAPLVAGNPATRFFGMEHPETKDRVAATSRSEADYCKDMGFCLRKVFASREAAERWAELNETQLPVPRSNREEERQHATKIGKDPSAGEREIFGVHMDMFDEMDAMCLPVGTLAEDTDGVYDCAVDVMALPGGYKSAGRDEDDDDVGDVAKALMTMATGRQETGLHMRYNARTQNGLRELKSQEDLSEFLEEVHEGWEHANETMTSQITRKMYRAGHKMESVTSYLQNGVLVRLIRDTYNFYTLFLTTLSGYANRMTSGEVWKDSVAGNLLALHMKQFMLIRSSSATYREMVLRNYAYLRNQHRTSFWNDKLSKKMAFVTSSTMARLSAPQAASGRGVGGSGAGAREEEAPERHRNYCTVCKRVHQGRPCPTTGLTAALRTRLGANLRQRDYEKALKHLKEALATNPSVDPTTAVDNARRAASAAA